jgi:hypothetical protein
MNLPPIQSFGLNPQLTPDALHQPVAGDREKVRESCRQFEAVLWKQVLEKAMAPGLGAPDRASDPSGVYQYMMCDTLSQAVSGGPKSFAQILENQLMRKNGSGGGSIQP